ncbi:GTP-binding protein At2g22870-like [Phragmites australis]|uniref:GTP-binding protein At2g22870-like n=1 Tax=Phragmites australis TaxID=29695 RepID=UPI002D768E02|nr:GTP-binding protein At2g22870-like [Phragmites australis]
MDWSAFTKGYFLNRDTLVGALLLIDASIPPQKIDLDCANWLGRNNIRQHILQLTIGLTFVFTKCDKVKKGIGGRPDENIKEFQDTISGLYPEPPPWVMTSSVTGLGRDRLHHHMSQLRNYWDNESV